MKSYNIVISGEHAAVRSLINSIGYGPDKPITHKYQPEGQETTVAVKMNFGSLQVDEDHRIDFFGGNDQHLFDFVSTLQTASMTGMMVILDADYAETIQHLNNALANHQKFLKRYSLVIGVTGTDYLRIKQTEELARQMLLDIDAVAPIFSINTTNQEDVNLLVESLLCFANPGIRENSSKAVSFGV